MIKEASMRKKTPRKLVAIFILCCLLSTGYASAKEEHIDNFNSIDLSRWTELTPNTWKIQNGMLMVFNEGKFIFNEYDGKQYIFEIDFTGNDLSIKDYKLIRFYFYYENLDKFERVGIADDNRRDQKDSIFIDGKGISFINQQTYINNSVNTSISLDPNMMHHLKVVRLNKNIYVYLDGSLAFTAEFKDENPDGKVGFEEYLSTAYFDNFYLRPITMENASDYINELNLNATTPTTRIGSIYTLSLDGVDNKEALFSLNKFGKTVDMATASQGDTVSLDFENGDEAVNFKVTSLFKAENNSAVWLEDIISASTDELNLAVDEITLNPSYHQEEDMDIKFSITNQGGIRFTGTPGITITTQGSNQTLNPELDLASNESKSFNATLTAPQKPGSQTSYHICQDRVLHHRGISGLPGKGTEPHRYHTVCRPAGG